EAQLILATIAQQYQARMVPGHQVQYAARITLYPSNGLPMTIYERQPELAAMGEGSLEA
ncbi:MAG: hypothetical protein H7Y11_01695, partial [Armatimonadetes bacterium]|nr:hypothetical protein [Anaerolineae bacterium]